jgi:hypothetical protein
VVITPAMEGETGLEQAGPLPLAEDARFPEANRLFLEHLRSHGHTTAAQALATAMDNGGDTGNDSASTA